MGNSVIAGYGKTGFAETGKYTLLLLTSKGALAPLLFRHAHHETLHSATQQMSNTKEADSGFWGPDGLSKPQSISFKMSMKTQNQLMANLPEFRTRPSLAFDFIGIDYCEPVEVRS